MRILRSVRHKACADGSFMKEFLLDTPVSPEFFTYLGNFGQVESLPGVGEGFYKFEKPDWFSIKGFSGDTTVEVRFKKEVMDLTIDFVYFLFSSYREGEVDLSSLKRREQAIGERVRKRIYGA
ncbi:MAG TPA: hypothetical protein PLN56_07400 [Methanoregulaceae archaeon]|nr:MAG: hypothetical protein IPI71_04210 [Methanolinea sp.]HON82109.1 hypothetical protein [Methanoregulaceae archaeon]HPD10807.1 hypothetical protein [Methanoregulaceae archaeon]HRT15995.1 hypothetical protein [Methanoregulaceae archaeon]HRU31460.1 hypothetical protein [Methanoregulaceae archaeon]